MADGMLPYRALEAAAIRPNPGDAALKGFNGHGFWRYDIASGGLSWAENSSRRASANALTDLTPEAIGSAIHPDDLDRFRSAMTEAAISGQGYTHTFRVLAIDGSWRVVSINATPETDAEGRVVAIFGGVLDITEIEICRTLAEEGDDIITQTDAAGVITYISPSLETVTGYKPAELVGRNIADILGAQVVKTMDAAIDAKAANSGAVLQAVQYNAPHKDGHKIWLESRLIPLIDPATGAHLGSTDVARDITQRKAAELELERANSLLKTLMEASPSGIIMVDDETRITSFNRTFLEIWNLSPETLQSGDAGAVLDQTLALVKDPEVARQGVNLVNSRPDDPSWDEIETTDGRWIDRYTVPVRAPDEGYLGRAWFFRDVTEHKRALAEAVRMARFDALTGLANRAALIETLERAATRARTNGEAFALFYLDLDGFKDVNDTLGHGVGDQLLVAVAGRLTSHCEGALAVARLGGDEFAVLVQGLLGVEDAAAFAEDLIRNVGAPSLIGEDQIHASVSLGVELFAADAPDAPTLLSRADMALYKAKATGAGSYSFFSEDMLTEARNRVRLAAELREALRADQLFLVYQPAVSLATGTIVGMEALVRWRHPKRGVLTPDIFIPVAEKMGLIRPLGAWVLAEAARQMRAWEDQGLPKIRMGVNVSALQFKNPEALEADIDAALHAADLPPWRLELELTESALMTASAEGDILGRLHRAGVRIAIDDFGTGYSSLDYLRRLPAHRIKIAQTFVRHLDVSPGDAAIVKATIGLARDLGMSVIAEGVETEAQMRRLAEWGCGECQGYYFDRPLSPEDAAERLARGGYVNMTDAKAA
jgi:diguanylate cyclase (GGDEF)-like protein/PAS domain S-box-containing protein